MVVRPIEEEEPVHLVKVFFSAKYSFGNCAGGICHVIFNIFRPL